MSILVQNLTYLASEKKRIKENIVMFYYFYVYEKSFNEMLLAGCTFSAYSNFFRDTKEIIAPYFTEITKRYGDFHCG